MSVLREDFLSETDPLKYKGISERFTITGNPGHSVTVLSYGARMEKLEVPDGSSNVADIMLGLRGLDEYLKDMSNQGAVVGRSANRIAGARFSLNGKEYELPDNDGGNNLHGGAPSYQNVFWEAKILSKAETDAYILKSGFDGIAPSVDEGLLLRYVSPDGACGFPGNLASEVLFTWLVDNTILNIYRGLSDEDTIFAPTNHSYFNLSGHNSGYIGRNILTVKADKVTLKSANNCPDGTLLDVAGTIFDFRNGAPVEQALTLENDQTKNSRGLDQNFCVDSEEGKYTVVAKLQDDRSDRVMEVLTDMPGIQFYAGNHLGGNDQKGDIPYKPYDALCLEAQMFPNAINVPEFTSPVIKAGVPVFHALGYRFNH